jgi:cytochrome P450
VAGQRLVDIPDVYALSAHWPEYAELRDHAPVYPVTVPSGRQIWLVSGYDPVQFVESDPRFLMSQASAVPEAPEYSLESIPEWARPLADSLMTSDPPEHTRLRQLVQASFSPRVLQGMRGRIQQIVDDLLDGFRTTGSLEVVGDFAFPMTTAVVADFLGFPYPDRELVAGWTQVLVKNFSGQDPHAVEQTVREFAAYLGTLFEEKRARPGDDVISLLVNASAEGALLAPELTAIVFVLVGGGFETTIVLLTHGLKALVDSPDQLRLLRERPELARCAVEELLRYGAGGTAPVRYPREDVVVAGHTIPRGAPVMPLYSSANFDPRRFNDPLRLDLARSGNRHFSFGHGPHYCLGAPLARIEAEIAFRTLATELPGLRLRPAEAVGGPNPAWQERVPFVRKIGRLELEFDRRAGDG